MVSTDYKILKEIILILFFSIFIIAVSEVSAVQTFSIVANTGSGGNITPAGTTIVNSGDNQIYTITPNSYFYVLNVFVDNFSIGPIQNYTFAHVSANHTISATFTNYPTMTFKYINSSASQGGTISPLGTISFTPIMKNQAYTITPDPGFGIANVLVDGVSKGALSTYSFTNFSGDHEIYAMFGSPPTTSDDFNEKKQAICQKTNQTITLSEQCGTSGCNWTKYCLEKNCNPANGTIYNGPVTIGEGKTYFRYQTKSNSGIMQNITERIFVIDPTCFSNPSMSVNTATENEINDTDYYISFNPTLNGTIQMSVRKTKSEPDLNPNSGVTSLGKYLEIIAPQLVGNISNATIKIMFSNDEISAAGIEKSTLKLWFYNLATSSWQVIDSLSGGINETDNYVWANTNHFSIWGIFGSTPAPPENPPAPSGSGGGSGGGGGGGGGSSISCTTNWKCTEWSPCIESRQTRSCSKANEHCSVSESKPIESQECIVKLASNYTKNDYAENITQIPANLSDSNTSSGISGITGAVIGAVNKNKKAIMGIVITLIIIIVASLISFRERKTSKKHIKK
ncbi:Uncharacterised protein [uncultured archaeon]|nr:Uncharacterised protein [uncultured archaeon]